jgi:quercetin dioxygenase-like cupin family protein
MRTFTLATTMLISAGLGAALMHAAQPAVMHSTVFEWTSGVPQANTWGSARQVTRNPTPTLQELEIHISTLDPGKSPHEPHRHPHEELLIIKEGTLATFQNGETRRVGPGGIIFQASNELHNVTNVGQGPAVYYVVGWTVPATSK